MEKYKKSFYIHNFATDKNGQLTPYNILQYFVEASSAHTDVLLKNVLDEDSLNLGWMIYRWKVKFNKYPKAKEKIYVETWASKLDRFYAYREFRMTNEKDEILAEASTVWIIVDMEKKRPIRMPSIVGDNFKVTGKSNFQDFDKFREEIKPENNIDFKVRRSDIDYNNHVNNSKYLLWILESLEEDIYENYKLSELEIIYKKEIKYGDTILSGNILHKKEDSEIIFYHNISGKRDDSDHAYGKTTWNKII